ncbi:ribonuclease HII [Brevibacillus fluminis]|uniref:Ribonuclease HII n=1 Tax=Brevibacillus fluminis TaxID=511487 RepID=A0A3M8DUY6_9BACL|nr:ribonuclease HII [Brevibacillus fluminis]RNB91906.1 ribonuclease HII [Brevibacillus fluminis]
MKLAEMSITEIRTELERTQEPSAELLAMLREDQRKGVQALYKQIEQRAAKKAMLEAKWNEMNRFEHAQRQAGKRYIVGIDEVGRGPLAGPVVACAVVLPEELVLPGLDDSKKVPVAERNRLYERIVAEATSVGIGTVDAERIDQINILEATKEAMKLAIAAISVPIDVCLIDAVTLPNLPFEQVPIIGGDAASVSIAAASIVAKVTRDRLMEEYARQYPQYSFEKNAGYGTKEHLAAIEAYGPSPIHRRSFTGVKEWVTGE